MEYRGIFPNSLELPNPLYAIAAFIGSVGLYYAVSRFIMEKLTEKLYFMSSHFDIINRTYYYYVLINIPILIIGIVSLIYHRSLIGIEISLNMDQIQLLLITGYICWSEQSRQTPIRGFLFYRDIVYMIGAIGIFANFYYSGFIQLMYGFIFLGYFLVFYIIQNFSNKIQGSLLLALGFQEPNNYNSQFLLTQKTIVGNILGIKDCIIENQNKIKRQIIQFDLMIDSLIQDPQDARIMKNFSKIFISIKKGMQIQQQLNHQDKCQQYDTTQTAHYILTKSYFDADCIEQDQIKQEDFDENKNSNNNFRGRSSGHSINLQMLSRSDVSLCQQIHDNSAQNIVITPIIQLNKQNINNNLRNTTITNQSVQQFVQDQTLFEKFIKYVYYPIYLLSFPDGRLRYFCDYLGFFILIGSMFLISNSGYYFSYLNSNNLAITSIVISIFLAYPPMKYFTRISAENDFDFMNMFLQGGVLKLVIFGITVTIHSFLETSKYVQSGFQNLIILGIRMITYVILTIFMTSKRFATRYTNFRFFIGLFGLEHCSRILVQIIYKNLTVNQTSL